MVTFFDDLEFIVYGYSEKSVAVADRRIFEDYYTAQFISRGRLYAKFGDGPEETGDGPLFFITYPGVPMSYWSLPGTDRDHYFIGVRGDRVQRYIDGGLLELRRENYFIPVVRPGIVTELFLQIVDNAEEVASQASHAKAVLLFEELLITIQMQSRIQSLDMSPFNSKLDDLRKKIMAHPEYHWNFREEIQDLSISYPYFCRIFSKIIGKSPKQYLLECRLQKAQKLLSCSNSRVSDIADQCGFDNAFYFYRTFSKYTKLGPLEYRKKYSTIDKFEF